MYVVTLENTSNRTFCYLTHRGRWSSEYPEARQFPSYAIAMKVAMQHPGAEVEAAESNPSALDVGAL